MGKVRMKHFNIFYCMGFPKAVKLLGVEMAKSPHLPINVIGKTYVRPKNKKLYLKRKFNYGYNIYLTKW